ncbi:MAG: carbon-nitrogen hydrolase family protein [Anaerolineae bacterium]|nr:carbon-nitrogen hydrolase family protein [Anaerolineae bacterium]
MGAENPRRITMNRAIAIAAVQMDTNPAPLGERLARAEVLVTQAAAAGAHLVVLPELFNLGYGYTDENFRRAEPLDGPTAAWMRATAAHLNVHLAGSLLLLDQDEIYNALLLYAPDGRCWRYDKHYPWAWERAYFRESDRITVAHTDLGDIGMMICWDVAHAELWRRYAGQVDLMLICSSPPDGGDPVYHFPNGDRITAEMMGPLFSRLKNAAQQTFGATINQQAAWLGVPAVNTVGCGHVTTGVPNALASFITILPLAPWLVKYLPQARRLQVTYTFVQGCKVVDADGTVLAELTQEQGETFAVAEVMVPEKRPEPRDAQPKLPVPLPAYWISDVLLPGLALPTYRRGSRRTWGPRMAPVRPATQRWLLALGAVALINYLVGWWRGRRRAV